MMTDAGWIAFGLVTGGLHFWLLRWNTLLYARPSRIGLGVAVQAVRMAAMGGLLFLAAVHGALPLLATAIGVLVARPVVMRLTAGAA